MVEPAKDYKSRVVVTGVNEQGRSHVVRDEVTEVATWVTTTQLNNVWTMGHVPTQVDLDNLVDADGYKAMPPEGGITVLVAAFPPDADWAANAWEVAREAVAANNMEAPQGRFPGYHQSDTVDVITVIHGELYAVLDEDDVRLLPGDSFIQRGTAHAWSNRTDTTAVAVVTLVHARRD
jgi:quercetin dioxygenase-like cupin family protein